MTYRHNVKRKADALGLTEAERERDRLRRHAEMTDRMLKIADKRIAELEAALKDAEEELRKSRDYIGHYHYSANGPVCPVCRIVNGHDEGCIVPTIAAAIAKAQEVLQDD